MHPIQEQVCLAEYTTLRLPVRARYFVRVSSLAALKDALHFSHNNGLPLLVLGEGSNLVVRQDFPGLCVKLELPGIRVAVQEGDAVQVTAAAGESWHAFVVYCLENGWHGLENLALIPGCVGASPVQNIGAYGVEIKDRMLALSALDRQTLQRRTFTRAECEFGYRDSVFKGRLRDRYIILSVTFLLSSQACSVSNYAGLRQWLPHPEPTPRALFDAVCAARRSKLPDPSTLPNVGSFFKNPVVGAPVHQVLQQRYPELVSYPVGGEFKLAAGWLIDHAGWKGVVDGAVAVHCDQALVLVNQAGGTGGDILRLAGRIQADIQRRFGIDLEIEPRVY